MKFKRIPVKTYYLSLEKCKKENILDRLIYELKEWDKKDIDIYLKYYKEIGGNWGWAGRLAMTGQELSKKLKDKNTRIYYLYQEGEIVGFLEFDIFEDNTSEIVYFGLSEKMIGKGLGKKFTNTCINKIFDTGVDKIKLHTCEYDHPRALANYRKVGFVVYKEQIDNEEYSVEYLKTLGKL